MRSTMMVSNHISGAGLRAATRTILFFILIANCGALLTVRHNTLLAARDLAYRPLIFCGFFTLVVFLPGFLNRFYNLSGQSSSDVLYLVPAMVNSLLGFFN